MAHCTILFPGLLGPDVPLIDLPRAEWPDKSQLSLLLSLLTHAQRRATPGWHCVEALLLHHLGYVFAADEELPVAALRRRTAPDSPETWWCLDPVFVQLDRELGYLAEVEELGLDEHEARELIASLNRHFAAELRIEYHQAQQWLLSADLHLHTHTPSEALLQDVKAMQPSGEDARRWRGQLNEMQMLLHAHPVNQQRLARQQHPVNSLWLWGGGRLQRRSAKIDIVYSNHVLCVAAAAGNAIAHAPPPARYTPAMFETQNVLVLHSEQLAAIRQKDVYAWFAALRDLETQLLQVVFPLLRQSRITTLTLCSEQVCFDLDKRALQKWWRRTRCLDAAILQLRSIYARET